MKIISSQEYSNLKVYEKNYLKMQEELKEAKDLKKVLEKLSSLEINGLSIGAVSGSYKIDFTVPDNVPVYVDDILGGKVIKQEAHKCIVIEKNGDVKTGLTKQDNDKGFSYKLIRK